MVNQFTIPLSWCFELTCWPCVVLHSCRRAYSFHYQDENRRRQCHFERKLRIHLAFEHGGAGRHWTIGSFQMFSDWSVWRWFVCQMHGWWTSPPSPLWRCFDLALCNLGRIPNEICLLGNLKELILSNNDLTGRHSCQIDVVNHSTIPFVTLFWLAFLQVEFQRKSSNWANWNALISDPTIWQVNTFTFMTNEISVRLRRQANVVNQFSHFFFDAVLCCFGFVFRWNSTWNLWNKEAHDAQFERQPADRSVSFHFYLQIEWFGQLNHLLHYTVFTRLCIGPIPPEICQLKSLTVLYLQRNQLTGQCFFIFIQPQWNKFAPSNKVVNQCDHF